ncbi:hypothetical protein LSAT2_025336, partial [Lamellibrachia satsuma]
MPNVLTVHTHEMLRSKTTRPKLTPTPASGAGGAADSAGLHVFHRGDGGCRLPDQQPRQRSLARVVRRHLPAARRHGTCARATLPVSITAADVFVRSPVAEERGSRGECGAAWRR